MGLKDVLEKQIESFELNRKRSSFVRDRKRGGRAEKEEARSKPKGDKEGNRGSEGEAIGSR